MNGKQNQFGFQSWIAPRQRQESEQCVPYELVGASSKFYQDWHQTGPRPFTWPLGTASKSTTTQPSTVERRAGPLGFSPAFLS